MKSKALILLVGIAIIFASCDSKKSGQTQSAPMAGNTVMGYKMVIVATLIVKPDKIEDFETAAKDIVEQSNKETGCLSYQLLHDPYNLSKFVFVEEYKNQDAVNAHFAADYYKAFGPKIGDLIDGAAEIKIFSVAKEVVQ